MGWKNWPYWLKGGVIGLLIYIIFFIAAILILVIFRLSISIDLFQIISLPTSLINSVFGIYSGHNDILTKLVITSLVIYFVIGALIGCIYGKIKKKKESGEGRKVKR